jgi:hypothetical protein
MNEAARQGEGERRPEQHMAEVELEVHRRGVEPGRRAEPPPGDRPHADDQQRRQPHAERADIVQPFAEAQPDDVEHRDREQRDQREADEIDRAVVEMGEAVAADVERIGRVEIKHAGEVRQVRGEIAPPDHEADGRPERAPRPDIEPALFGIARRQLDHRQHQRQIESQEGADPDQDRARPGGSGGGDPAQADAGDDIEQREVGDAHHPGRMCSGSPACHG